MVRSVLVLVLVASVAWADDAPRRAAHVAPGFVVTEPSWVFTDEGKGRVDALLQSQSSELEKLKAENKSLRSDVVRVSGEPALTWRGAALLVGAGLVVGASVALVVRR